MASGADEKEGKGERESQATCKGPFPFPNLRCAGLVVAGRKLPMPPGRRAIRSKTAAAGGGDMGLAKRSWYFPYITFDLCLFLACLHAYASQRATANRTGSLSLSLFFLSLFFFFSRSP